MRKWLDRLQLNGATWSVVEVDPQHVTGEDGSPGSADFVGVHRQFTLFHSRPLIEEDVVHELLHVKHPHWSESRVRRRTRELLG